MIFKTNALDVSGNSQHESHGAIPPAEISRYTKGTDKQVEEKERPNHGDAATRFWFLPQTFFLVSLHSRAPLGPEENVGRTVTVSGRRCALKAWDESVSRGCAVVFYRFPEETRNPSNSPGFRRYRKKLVFLFLPAKYLLDDYLLLLVHTQH